MSILNMALLSSILMVAHLGLSSLRVPQLSQADNSYGGCTSETKAVL